WSNRAKRLAHRENDGKTSDASLILADLATKVSSRESRALATDVQARMVRAVRRVNSSARDLGAKPAMLHVLMGARCPAILVEAAFVSNPRESELLRRADYQEAVASGVADGVLAHLGKPAIAQAN
ncbi:MAG: N-acetylmuramoyl-L-alanine amidase, partial [Myxococcota bacterium]